MHLACENSVFTQENQVFEENVFFLSSVINKEGRLMARGSQLPQRQKNIHAACKPCNSKGMKLAVGVPPDRTHSLIIYAPLQV